MDISTKNSGYESLFDRCSSLCSELVKQGCKFSFSLKLEESFSFTLSSEKAVPRGTRKRPPSYQRRQHRRKTELLQRRTEFRRTNEAAEDIDNDGRRQEGADLLDKKMVSSRQTATEENNSSLDLGPYLVRGLVGDSNPKKVDSTVDNNTPLNPHPRAIYPRGSVESVEQEEDLDKTKMETGTDFDAIQQEDTVIGGFPVGNTRLGSNCEMCQQTIVDKGWRHFPAQCGKCWIRTLNRNDRYSVV